MLEICIQTSYDQNVQLILKSYLPVVYGTLLRADQILPEVYGTTLRSTLSTEKSVQNRKALYT
jgi:hypothetical protein